MCRFTVFSFPKKSTTLIRKRRSGRHRTGRRRFGRKRRKRSVEELTYVSWGATGSGHDVSGALHLGEAEVADHDLRLVLGVKIQQILWLNAKKKGVKNSVPS